MALGHLSTREIYQWNQMPNWLIALCRRNWPGPCEGGEGYPMKGSVMKQSILNFIRDESGAAAAEYALILAIVGAGIAVAAKNLGTAISSAINTAQSNI